MSKGTINVEYDRRYEGDMVWYSKIRPATEEEIRNERYGFETTGACDHTIVQDTFGWMYDDRYCYTCGKYLGMV